MSPIALSCWRGFLTRWTVGLFIILLATPLFGVDSVDGDPRPVRLERLTSALDALSALSAVDPADGNDRFAAVRGQAQLLRDQGDDSARALVGEELAAEAGLSFIKLYASLNSVTFYQLNGYDSLGAAVLPLNREVTVACELMRKYL